MELLCLRFVILIQFSKPMAGKRKPTSVRQSGLLHVLNVIFITCGLLCLFQQTTMAQTPNIAEPVPPPTAVRNIFGLAPFYQQWIDVGGVPVIASAETNPYAVKEAAYLIKQMIGHRQDVLQTLAENGVRFSVMAYTEMTTKIPEHSYLRPDFYWAIRARGLGGQTTSCGEENLLNYPNDPYWTENTLIHEFAHTLHRNALNMIDPGFDDRLGMTYDAAINKGLWEGTFASTDRDEYWAEGVQSWFHANANEKSDPALHNNIDTRVELKAYDPALARLLTEVFGDSAWQYTPPATRSHLPHLQGFNSQDSPTFKWPSEVYQLYAEFINNPDSNGNGKWVNLKQYDPSLISNLNVSRHETSPTEVLFVNFSNVSVSIYWMGSDGTEHFRAQLHPIPGNNRFFTGNVGDIWLVKDLNGSNLAVFRTEEKTGRAGIRIGHTSVPKEVKSLNVRLPDANLEATVRKALDLDPSAPITQQTMQELTILSAGESQIRNLTGLEHATGLVQLSLWDNQIQDVTPLVGLTQLRQLHLQSNQITDITPLVGLKQLQQLHLWGNQISDISVLARLTKLESLWLQGNPIKDKSPLHTLLKRNPNLELDIDVPQLPSVPAENEFSTGDVNQDKKVNILDLVMIAQNLGHVSPDKPHLDVNADGNINILDLVFVAQNLGE